MLCRIQTIPKVRYARESRLPQLGNGGLLLKKTISRKDAEAQRRKKLRLESRGSFAVFDRAAGLARRLASHVGSTARTTT